MDYQTDLVRGLLWLTGVLGALGLGTITWGIKAALGRMDKQEESNAETRTMMQTGLTEIRDLLQSELVEIRTMHHALDVRVTKIEARCAIVTGGSSNHNMGIK